MDVWRWRDRRSLVWKSTYLLPRMLLACAAIALATVGTSACGSAGRSSAGKASAVSGHDADQDIDSRGQGGRYDTDNDATFGWGPLADAADRRAIVALVKRYYEAAAAGDGARACTMLDPLIAEEMIEQNRHSTCARIMSRMFQPRHRELVEDVAAFRITAVQLRGNRAVALTDFSPTRLLEVFVRRGHGVWRMDTPLDNGAV